MPRGGGQRGDGGRTDSLPSIHSQKLFMPPPLLRSISRSLADRPRFAVVPFPVEEKETSELRLNQYPNVGNDNGRLRPARRQWKEGGNAAAQAISCRVQHDDVVADGRASEELSRIQVQRPRDNLPIYNPQRSLFAFLRNSEVAHAAAAATWGQQLNTLSPADGPPLIFAAFRVAVPGTLPLPPLLRAITSRNNNPAGGGREREGRREGG